MSEQQRTLAKDVFMNVQGIHTGMPVSIRLLPASADTGIVFVRTDLPHRPSISVKSAQVVSVEKSVRRTTLCKDGVEVQTVEHVLGMYDYRLRVVARDISDFERILRRRIMTLPGAGNVEANVLLSEERLPGPIG